MAGGFKLKFKHFASDSHVFPAPGGPMSSWKRSAPFLVIALIGTCLSGASARGALINFNTPGDLAGNFFISDPAPFPFAEMDAVGVGTPASRALGVTGITD